MDWVTEPERKTPVVASVDSLVCGGGFAGVAAAVSAAQNGAEVLVLEKYGFLGGLATTALVITTPPLNNGINIEIAQRLWEKPIENRPLKSGEAGEKQSLYAFDPERVKYEFVRMLQEHGVDILLHTYIVGSIMEGNVIKGVIIENKGGRQAILCKMVIDATGDADVAAFAGAPFRLIRKPMTMMFNMVGVDVQQTLKEIGSWDHIRNLVKAAIDKGQLPFDLGINRDFGAPGVQAIKVVYEGEISVWSGNLLGMDGIDPRDLTKAEVITREHTMRLATFLQENVPGFEKSRIEYTAPQVGVRATRQIIGKASPSMDEVRTQKFDDTVAKPYAKKEIRLPYGSILPRKIENLLVAGRCISAEEDAMEQLRLIPVCSASGQAAGTAAALAVVHGLGPGQLDTSLIQKSLMEQGMDLGLT